MICLADLFSRLLEAVARRDSRRCSGIMQHSRSVNCSYDKFFTVVSCKEEERAAVHVYITQLACALWPPVHSPRGPVTEFHCIYIFLSRLLSLPTLSLSLLRFQLLSLDASLVSANISLCTGIFDTVWGVWGAKLIMLPFYQLSSFICGFISQRGKDLS